MTEDDTPRDEARDGAGEPGHSPERPAGAESPEPVGGGESLRRWLPRRRGTSQADADAAAAAATGEPPASGEASRPDPAAAETAPRPRRRWGRHRAAGEEAETETPPEAGGGAAGPAPMAADTETHPGRLRRRRKRLISDREVAVYHLGGLAFELYRRDLLDEQVLRRRAGAVALIDEAVHDIDMRLEQLDAERRERRGGRADTGPATTGNCLTCRAPFQAEARFCWQCGARLTPPDPDLDAEITQAISTPRT
jgi:hypothetical protein